MIFDLSKVEFANDVFKYEIESGTLIFYSVNESIKRDDLEVPIKRVVVAVEDLDENQTILSSIIGFEKDGYLYVIYSICKEDVAVSKIRISDLT